MTNWDYKFIELSKYIAEWSKDMSKKVGCVIVNDDHAVLSIAYNGLARGVDEEVVARHQRPEKYMYIVHAEANAMFHAARHGISVKGCTAYVTLFPCASCANAMIQSGIKKVWAPEPDMTHERWGEQFRCAKVILDEADR